MEMKVFWTDFSKSELQQIFDYYKQNAGLKVTRRLVEGIVSKTEILRKNPSIGQAEELLSDRIEEFRYLVHRNYKIIYWVNIKMKRIEIVDVFDTRQNPLKVKRI
jgi:toxin ParE1/3/4